MKSTFLFFYTVIVLMAFPAERGQTDTVRIQVNYREASEILPAVQSVLSPSGQVVVDEQTNALIVTDGETNLERVRSLMPVLDVLGKQVRVRMRFQEIRSATERDLSVGGRISGEGWDISADGRRQSGAAVILQDERGRGERSSESFITVGSGSSAYITVGKDIPYRERWVFLSRRYAELVETVVFRRVETGMEVRPIVTGKVARVEIIPRISYETGEGETGTIRFTTAHTEMTVPLKQWVSIGGSAVENNEVMKSLLESGKGTRDRSVAIWMMVEEQ